MKTSFDWTIQMPMGAGLSPGGGRGYGGGTGAAAAPVAIDRQFLGATIPTLFNLFKVIHA